MHFHFTGLAAFFLMSSQKSRPECGVIKKGKTINRRKRLRTSPSFKTHQILTDLNIAGNNNRLRAIKSKIKPLLPSDIPHIMEIFYNASHLWSSIHYKLYYARNIMMTCGVNCPALIGFQGGRSDLLYVAWN